MNTRDLSLAGPNKGRSAVAGETRAVIGVSAIALLLVTVLLPTASAATAPPLGVASTFAVLGGAAVTNTGLTIVNGDLGVSPGTAITGFPPGVVIGTIHDNDAVAAQAHADAVTAYNALAVQACNTVLTGQDLGGKTLTPGVYCFASSAQLTGTLTLDALGDPNAVWVFQIASTLTTASNAAVNIINGGSVCNVFWQVGSSATLGIGTAFKGNIIALASVTMVTGASLAGKALALTGAVTMDTNSVATSSCAPTPPDLLITKTHVGAFTQLGTGVYTITVTNTGTGPTAGVITVVDTLPAGLVATSISGLGWTCILGTLTCTRIDPLPAGLSYPPITLTVTVACTAPPMVTNSATVTGGGVAIDPDDTANDPTIITPNPACIAAPDLLITKTHVGNFTQGQVGATYTITVSNTGTAALTTTTTVVDTLPAGLTATAIGGAGWTCVLATLTCTRADPLGPGLSYPPITLTVNVSCLAAAAVTNSATVTNIFVAGDPDDTAADPTIINAGCPATPDLRIAKAHVGNFTQGQIGGTYTITVTNSGLGTLTGTTTVVDTLPPGLVATSISGPGWTCVLGTLICTRADPLGPGLSYPLITLTVNVLCTAPPVVTNSATVSNPAVPADADDTALDPTIITPGCIVTTPDLLITKSHLGNFTQGQVGATYVITVTNTGTGPTSGTTTVVDTLPAGLTATAISGTGWTCVLATLTCTRADPLGPGLSYPPITITVNISCLAPLAVTNSATVTNPNVAPDPDDTATDPTIINAGCTVPDLSITKTHVGNFSPGQVGATYTITVTNSGTAILTGTTTVVDTLPPGVTATAISGTGWTCILATLTCTRADPLGPGLSYPPITLTVNISCTAALAITNTATVSNPAVAADADDTAADVALLGGGCLDYQLRYFANLDKGDSYINLTNAGTLNGFDPAGRICINAYTFDPAEELISCCACPVTPNGLASLSVRNDLISNTLTAGVPTSVTVKLLSSVPIAGVCNAASPNASNLVRGARAWATTLHLNTAIVPAPVYQKTETPFSLVELSPSELAKLTSFCAFIQANGSGFGICKSCRVGALGAEQK